MRRKSMVMTLGLALVIAVIVIVVMMWKPKTERVELPKKQKPALVLFYSDGCVHSRNMMGEWQKLKGMNGVDVISFEHAKDPAEIAKNRVSGFPTIRVYPGGYPGSYVEYNGPRTAASISDFVTGTQTGTGQPPEQLATATATTSTDELF